MLVCVDDGARGAGDEAPRGGARVCCRDLGLEEVYEGDEGGVAVLRFGAQELDVQVKAGGPALLDNLVRVAVRVVLKHGLGVLSGAVVDTIGLAPFAFGGVECHEEGIAPLGEVLLCWVDIEVPSASLSWRGS